MAQSTMINHASKSIPPTQGWREQRCNNGQEIKAIWDAFDKRMDQNANVAWHLGLVNTVFEAEPHREAGARRPHKGMSRETSSAIHAGKGPSGMCWYRDISSLEGEGKIEALGNDAADERAKAAVAESDWEGMSGRKSVTPMRGATKSLVRSGRASLRGRLLMRCLASSLSSPRT